MGLKVSDFNINELKGKDILEMRIDVENESTVTFADKAGKTTRRRIPAPLAHLMEWYCSAEAV